MKGDNLSSLLKCLRVWLTGATRSSDIAERLMGMSQIRALNSRDASNDDITTVMILYLTYKVDFIVFNF